MKKLWIAMILVMGVAFLACQNPNIAEVEVTNPNGEAVAFSGFYSSNMIDSTNVTGTTPMTYKIDVNSDDDYVLAGFTKTTVTDSENELKIELIYMGDTKDVETVTIPLIGWAIVNCNIP